jgi:hypothetical protein
MRYLLAVMLLAMGCDTTYTVRTWDYWEGEADTSASFAGTLTLTIERSRYTLADDTGTLSEGAASTYKVFNVRHVRLIEQEWTLIDPINDLWAWLPTGNQLDGTWEDIDADTRSASLTGESAMGVHEWLTATTVRQWKTTTN